jgi:hypothetical protein
LVALSVVLSAFLWLGQGQTDPAAIASVIAADLARHPFALSTDQWRKQVPSAEWRERRGAESWRRNGEDPRDFWCMAARDRQSGVDREVRFYAFRSALPLACRLEQLHYTVPGDTAHAERVYAAIVASLTERFGDRNIFDNAEHPDRYITGAWTNVKMWHRGTSYVWLYRGPQGVGVFARHHLLESGARAADDLPESFSTFGYNSVTWEVANLLWPLFPEASDLLLDSHAIPDQAAVLRTSIALLKAADRQKTMEMRGATAIGAQGLLGKLWIEGETPPLQRPEYASLRPFDLDCAYDGHGGGWACGTGLLPAFVGQYPHSRWSHQMYLEGLGRECDGFGYRQVIEEAVPWLRRHPGSEFGPFVTAAIAQAYETWWSLSLAPADEEFVTAAEYSEGAARARELAIEWYHRLRGEYPQSVEARLSVTRANQLEIGVDTAQRRYFCVIP